MVLLGGRPERLILERPDPDGVDRRWRLDDPLNARVRSVSRGLGMGFLTAGSEMPELTAPAAGLVEGQAVAARVVAPPRREKLAAAHVLGPTGDPIGRSAPPSTVADRLQAAAPDAPIEVGPDARRAADAAQEEALATEHSLPGGARLFVERTRALIAVDVDVGASAQAGDVRRRQRQANLAAIEALPRLLRLKALGGVVAIDLVGKGHDGATLAAAAAAAFGSVYAGAAALGPISRFGVMQLQLPWLDTPVAEILNDDDGVPTPTTRAFALLRAIEREAGPGGRVEARCAPAVFVAACAPAERLRAIIGDRFLLAADSSVPADRPVLQLL